MASTLEIEINSATDNPLIFPNPANPGPEEVISQGNFHGEILAICADNLSHSLFELAHISERRIDQIVDLVRAIYLLLSQEFRPRIRYDDCTLVAAASLAEMHGRASPPQHFQHPLLVVKKTMFQWALLLVGIWLR